jgi:hypothetical protein
VWKPFSRHFGDNKEILTHVTWTDYAGPDGVIHNDIEMTPEGDDPVQTDASLQGSNSMLKVSNLVNHVQEITRYYPNKENFLVMIGDDFGYADAMDDFKQADHLIALCNKHNNRNITFKYSTPTTFIEAVKKENIAWPVYYGDMFPYHQFKYEYWSGFYSSRTSLKKQVKDFSKLYHA